MIIDNDDMIIWREPSHMILKGEVIEGEMIVTIKNIYFIQIDEKKLFRKDRPVHEIWDLHINSIKDINIHEVKGHKAPYIRIHYKENDAYFTFPGKDLEQALAALILFVNHSRTIYKLVANAKNIGGNLDEGTLNVGNDKPKLISGLPSRVDEECYQCGKPLVEDDFDQIVEDIRECLSCPIEE